MQFSDAVGVGSIVWLDIVLSGDNALVIGLAASTVQEKFRRHAIIFGLILATVMRILFAGAATYLLGIPGLIFIGGVALLWVSYTLYCEVAKLDHSTPYEREHRTADQAQSTLFRALVSITVADISMSIDNVLAVAAIARDNIQMLAFGITLSIALMGLCATLIMNVLLRYRWISYGGIGLLVFIGGHMIWEGWRDVVVLAQALGGGW